MGYIISHSDDRIGIEVRRESIEFHEQTEADTNHRHIFASHNGHVEISKELLSLYLAFFDNPDNRKLCGLDVSAPLESGR